MAKHMPKPFEFTIQNIPTDLQKLSGLFSNTHVYTCGNCNYPVVFPYLTPRPIRCKKCGEDIDWSGQEEKGDRRTKICPRCKTWFAPADEFCNKCATKVKLIWSD